MNKTTILLLKTLPDGSCQLQRVSRQEWYQLLKNLHRSASPRRFFIRDRIVEPDNTVDEMIIEVSQEDFRIWNREHTRSERNRRLREQYHHYPVERLSPDDLQNPNMIDSSSDPEQLYLQKELLEHLKNWKPYGPDFLFAYLNNQRRDSTRIIAEKYGVSMQTARFYRNLFEKEITVFLCLPSKEEAVAQLGRSRKEKTQESRKDS